MSQFEIVLVVVGATVLVTGLFSQLIKQSFVQEPLIAVGVGIVVGPYALGWLDVRLWGDVNSVLERVAELTLAIGLMAVALRLTPRRVRRYWRPVLWLLTAGMLAMWAASSLLAAWLLALPLSLALLAGAVLTPTDPVIASSIVTGRFAESHLPDKIRSSLSLESGANDGLALLFMMAPVLMLTERSDLAFQRWIVETLAWGVAMGALLGAALGYAAGRLLHWATTRSLIESYSFLTYTVTLSLFTLGAASLLGTDALVAVFAAGLVFNLWSDTGERHEEERIQEAFSKLFLLPMFVVFGVALPWDAWGEGGWPLVGFVASVMLLRRLPMVLLIFRGVRGHYDDRDAAYIGWFGPIGVAAIYYAALAVELTGETLIWEVTSAVVLCSILAHGVSATPLTTLYARGRRDSGRSAADAARESLEAGD